ncbi:MAG: hypothetical protein GQ583_03145 [Methyloprofundus sp.]|nr:hypothetical protein [Methyloprofundus sp.]
MELAEYGKVSALLFLYSASSIQATLEQRLADIIKSALLSHKKAPNEKSLGAYKTSDKNLMTRLPLP